MGLISRVSSRTYSKKMPEKISIKSINQEKQSLVLHDELQKRNKRPDTIYPHLAPATANLAAPPSYNPHVQNVQPTAPQVVPNPFVQQPPQMHMNVNISQPQGG